AATGAIFVLGMGRAHAGNGGYQPYWEDTDPTRQAEQAQVPPGDPSLVEWHAGLRIGPYTPDIDNQLDMHPGPFQQMFGTTQHMMTMLDVDRFLWTGFGQVGVGVSVGYWQKTARALGAQPDGTPTSMRDASAHNAMRLVPLALTATYRFTVLDDNYGIPVVPYARAGLGYYVWWISINDHFARVCSDGGLEPNCSQNKALGASLGLQGAIGLAIRAERIDASAAMSMQQSGIQHAGIYAELSLAKMDGFGSDQKLSVGDRTWFAGVDFEF
ncbi:MAG TPA: MXAN_2562 family outer membrane beta-barrel protein, partial [Kofleriaceae bacterium]